MALRLRLIRAVKIRYKAWRDYRRETGPLNQKVRRLNIETTGLVGQIMRNPGDLAINERLGARLKEKDELKAQIETAKKTFFRKLFLRKANL